MRRSSRTRITFDLRAGLQIEIVGALQNCPIENGDEFVVDYPGVIILLVTKTCGQTPVQIHFIVKSPLQTTYDSYEHDAWEIPASARILIPIDRPGMYTLTAAHPELENGGYM